MAIVKMSNFSLFAFDSERENLLHELQKFKYVHFLDLDEDESLKDEGLQSVEIPETVVAIDEEIMKVKYSIDLLAKHNVGDNFVEALKKGKENFSFVELEEIASKIDYHGVYDKLKKIDTNKEALKQEVIKLTALKDDLSHWIKIDTPIKDLASFEQSQMFLGTIPKKLKLKIQNELVETELTHFEIISEDKDNLYVIVLTYGFEVEKAKDILRFNSFSAIKLTGEDTPEKEISRIDERIKALEADISDYENQLKDLTSNLRDLQIVYDYLMNEKLRVISSEKFLMTENVNIIKGYIPTEMVSEFTETVKAALNNVYYLEIKEADKNDPKVPILLENSKLVKSFESITNMYSLPKYNEIDPTPFIAPFYMFFFGMMLADAGYGIVMLIAAVAALKLFNLSEKQKDFIKFFYYLSYPTIFWGLIYGSFFTGAIPLPALINPNTEYFKVLILSVVFGIIHLYFGLGLKAYQSIREGKYLDALFDVGFWYMALTGGIGFLAGSLITLPIIIKNISLIVMIVGMAGIVLTSARDSKTIVGKAAGGLYNLYGISGYVGDFVSYSRLMALGLSGGFIGSAMNMIAGDLFNSGVVGIIIGVIIFIGGQFFNIFLSALGAYVHSMRLIFVEFFGKFYEGGGIPFKLFRSEPKYINLK
ncbi:V-type ATP synthase subunit I [Lutispora thermophila]|uniref:V/A-type H+-transporting ATPase subunit I n=1 Tax=Lutispora thermophila DSM 19022 TaxID=1122184 RepID=A0A1M6CLQ9_9FIRM|nr:V-type ATP synthase subunit I [Lutispora thermophila]SHI61946.1 V/A-type H+-transporting ATPase subunit I [Lutispora thermophila DSM 19022]